jgi:RHS repeat-associated protein
MTNRSFSAAASRLTSAASAQYNNVVNRAYDSASRILSETLTVGATPYSVGYGYDADNRQTHVIYPNGAIVDRTFTVRNQLQSVAYNGVNAAILNYDNAGRLSIKTFGNGLVETRTYQTDNLNATITTPGVAAFGYTWDANKRKLTQTETGIPTNNQVYTYDNEDRLTGFNRNNGDTQAWTLSLVGDWNQFNNNGVMENRTHNAVHELTAVNATALTYDVKGNLTGNSNGQTYAWDIENRLTTATDNQNNTFGTYTYDALGRRVSKTVGGNTTVFISDGLQKICEYENGTLARAYAYGSYIDEPLVMISGVNKYYYHSNNLYSVAALTDNAGTVIERYKYDPYGKATILAPDGTTIRTASIVNNPFMYDGYYHDAETGLEFVNARYYSSDLGRFIARDPIGYGGGRNLYEYVKGQAVRWVDPSGLRPPKPWEIGGKDYIPPPYIGPDFLLLNAVFAAWKYNFTCKECDCYMKVLHVKAVPHANAAAEFVLTQTGHVQVQFVRVPKGTAPDTAEPVTTGRSTGGVQLESQGGRWYLGGTKILKETAWIKFECDRMDVFQQYLLETRYRSRKIKRVSSVDGYDLLYESCATFGVEGYQCLTGVGTSMKKDTPPPSGTPQQDDWRPTSKYTLTTEVFKPSEAVQFVDKCAKESHLEYKNE